MTGKYVWCITIVHAHQWGIYVSKNKYKYINAADHRLRQVTKRQEKGEVGDSIKLDCYTSNGVFHLFSRLSSHVSTFVYLKRK